MAERTPEIAYVASCDAGNCSRPTMAVVLTPDSGWLSCCHFHGAAELMRVGILADLGEQFREDFQGPLAGGS